MTNTITLRTLGIVMMLLTIAVYFFLASIVLGQENTYLYVDNFGVTQEIVADSPQEALFIAVNIHPNSGVILVDESDDAALEGDNVVVNTSFNGLFGTGGAENIVYSYIDVSGNVRTVIADSPEQAIAIAVNIHPNSGVKVVDF